MIIPSLPSTGIREEIKELLNNITKKSNHKALMRLNNIESLTSSYFSSRGEIRKDVNKDIKYIRGLVKYGMNEKAIEKVADLVNDLKEYKRENPKERIREVRMEIEQAFTDFNSGKIDRDECVSIVRESLENLEEMEDYFERLEREIKGGR